MDRIERQALSEQMRRLADGDRAAFDPVFESLWPILRRFAARFVPADAEDAAQRALLRVFTRAGEFDPERDALSWALGIAFNECRDLRRSRNRRREDALAADAADTLSDPETSPEERAINADLHAALAAAMANLTPAEVDVLRAHVGELARPDLAAATFRKRVERALRRLRAAWSIEHGI